MYSKNTLDRDQDEIHTEGQVHQDVPLYEQFSSDKKILFEI